MVMRLQESVDLRKPGDARQGPDRRLHKNGEKGKKEKEKEKKKSSRRKHCLGPVMTV